MSDILRASALNNACLWLFARDSSL